MLCQEGPSEQVGIHDWLEHSIASVTHIIDHWGGLTCAAKQEHMHMYILFNTRYSSHACYCSISMILQVQRVLHLSVL